MTLKNKMVSEMRSEINNVTIRVFDEFLKMIPNHAYLRSQTLNYRDTGQNGK
jgi:hypothetical protein